MKNILAIFAFFSFANVWAQKYQEVDLSKSTSEQNTPTISLNHKGIKLINKLPKGTYKVKIEVEEEKDGIASAAYAAEEVKPCYDKNPKFKTAYDNLLQADDESKISNLKKALNDGLKTATPDCTANLKIDATKLIGETEETSDFSFDLKKNQNITIIISRIDDDGKETKNWTVTMQTPRTVNYISHFGFSYVPNGNRNSDKYFSKQTGTNAYTITQMNNNGQDFWKDLSLTANYIIPICNISKNEVVKFGWNGGFGLNGNANFTVFTGPTLLFDDFISLNLNLGLYNQYKLRGEYQSGQQITENLSIDQLNEQGLRPAFIISLGFRLSKEQLQAAIEKKGGKQ
jgi:hypothetical protein